MTEHVVGRDGDLPVGGLRQVEVEGRTLCIARTSDGGLHAFDGFCTHEQTALADGELLGHEVECPQHGSRFDLLTGEATELPAELPIRIYPIRVRDGDLRVEI